jgi:hypothetical protein
MARFHPAGYHLSILLVIAIILLHPAVGAEAEPAAKPSTQPGEAPAIELHKLKNADLLEQVENALAQATGHLSGQVRALAVEDHRYQQARQARLALEPPNTKAETTSDLLQQAKHKADVTQAQATYVQDRQKRIENEQALLEAWIQRNQSVQQAIVELSSTIENLRNGALLEVGLRVQDGTLAAIPKHLQAKALDKIIRTIKPQQADLQKTLVQRQQDLQAISALHREGKQALVQAQQQVKITQQDYQQSLKRRELEQLYATQSAQQRTSAFADLQEERVWLQGSLRLSQAKFAALAAQVNPLSALNTEQDDELDLAPREIMLAYDENIHRLQRQKAALDELVKFAPVVRADLDLVRTHLFKMLVLAQQDDTQAQQVDELTKAFQQIQDDTQQVDQALANSPQQITRLTAQIEQASQQRDRIRTELADAESKQSAAQQDKEREARLKTLDDQQLVQYFIDTQKMVQEQAQNKQAQMDKLKQAQQQVDTARNQMQGIKDSLIHLAEQQAAPEKANILQALHKLAGLPLPPAQAVAQNVPATEEGETQTILERDDAKKDPVKLNRYENRLAARLRTMQEHQQKRGELLKAFNALQQVLQEQVAYFTDARQKRFDLYAAAVELRKRLGQGSLARDSIPDGVIDALQPESLTQLESRMAELAGRQARIGQTIQRLNTSADPDTELEERIEAIRMSVGERIEIFDDLYRLQDSVVLGPDDLTGSAQKNLQQTAIRRMGSEDSLKDILLSLVPSQRAQGILELLQSYYAELIHLEGQQESLNKQKAQTQRLIEYARSEQQALREFIPLLESRLEGQKQARDAYDASVRIQLAPGQATEIMQDYQHRTGQALDMPKPLPEAQHEQAIPVFADTLFDHHIRILAAEQWIAQLKNRLTARGINFEIKHYRDTLNQVDDHSARIQRRIQYLSGYTQSPSDAVGSDQAGVAQQKPDTPVPDNKTLDSSQPHGLIFELRNDLQQTRMQGALSVVYEIAIILLVAAFLIWLINHFMNRMIQRASTPQADGIIDQHAVLAWIAIRSVARLIVQIVTLIMILGSFGFQVGAILAGLGIGGLAVAMAAKESLSNILAGVMIFLDKPFTVGDVIKVGSYTTAKVESIGWRTTSVASAFGHYTHIPNSEVAEKPVTNYTKLFPAGDFMSVFISHEYDPDKICELINQALEQCTAIEQNESKGCMVAGVKVIHQDAWMEYWPWWYTKDYHKRSGQREQVWYHIWKVLTKAGISFTRPDGPSPALLPAGNGSEGSVAKRLND